MGRHPLLEARDDPGSVPMMSTGRRVVLLDCDGPLANFTGAYLNAFLVLTGRLAVEDEVDRWAIHECGFFQEEAARRGETPGQLRKAIDAMVVAPGFCENIRPQKAAVEAVAKLRELADVYVVTSPWDSSPTWMYERLHWVHRHFDIPRGHVIQTGRKHLVRGDIFVDDKPSHVVEWQAAWPGSLGVLFDMHHNRAETPEGIPRAGWRFVIAAASELPGEGEGER